MNKKTIILTTIIILISSVMLFLSGYFIRSLIIQEKNIESIPNKDNYPDSGSKSFDSNDSTLFLPDLSYFDDTIILISKDEPHYSLVATVSRNEKSDLNYIQNTRISFFDGTEWKRVTKSDQTKNSAIKNNEFIQDWTIEYDKSRVLKQDVSGNLVIRENKIGFESGILENEISIRSLPGYTKFMSEGDGKLIINNQQFDSYLLYTRIYSMNSSEIVKYNGNLGLLTDWIAFWDNQGNFYHIDSTSVDKPIPNYQPHKISILKDDSGSITKTFSVVINRDQNMPPQNYLIKIGHPINKSLQFKKYNDINKSPTGTYVWHMGNIKNSEGVGLVEYIWEKP